MTAAAESALCQILADPIISIPDAIVVDGCCSWCTLSIAVLTFERKVTGISTVPARPLSDLVRGGGCPVRVAPRRRPHGSATGAPRLLTTDGDVTPSQAEPPGSFLVTPSSPFVDGARRGGTPGMLPKIMYCR